MSADAVPAPDSELADNPAQAASDERTGMAADAETVAAAADRASESLFSRAGPAPINSTQLDSIPFEVNKAGEKIPLANSDGSTDTEKAVLERLSDRRAELDALENQIKQREAVVAAAEMRLKRAGGRAQGARGADQRPWSNARRRPTTSSSRGLVSMYETMKPKDAAAIFNQLSNDVLYRVAIAMNPRKMAPVLAAMTTNRAQELTTLLAAEQGEPSIASAADDLSQLPQIIGQ